MASELQRQVQQHEKHVLKTASLSEGRASLFLTPKEAAAVDIKEVYEAGLNGLKVLIQYDARFESFLSNLFHVSSMEVQRELKTKEENEAIDREVYKLLGLLSIWTNEPNAHLVLEYLIRRYRINEINSESLIKFFIISHDTKIFSKIIQISKLNDTPWAFLNHYKESSNPIPRSFLVNKCQKNNFILESLTELVFYAFQLADIKKGSKNPIKQEINNKIFQGVSKILSFYTTFVLELSEKIIFDDKKIRIVFLFLLEGLKIRTNSLFNQYQLEIINDWKHSSCLLISQISRKTRFAAPLIRAFSNGLGVALSHIKAKEEDVSSRSLSVSIILTSCILSQQKQLEMTSNLLSSIYKEGIFSSSVVTDSSTPEIDSWLFRILAEINEVDTTSFIHQIMETTCQKLLKTDDENEDNSEDIDRSGLLSLHVLITNLIKFFQYYSYKKNNYLTLKEYIIDIIIKIILYETEEENLLEGLIQIIKAASNWLPSLFEESINACFIKFPSKKSHINNFLSNIFVEKKLLQNYSDQNNTLYFSLNSPIIEIRMEALINYSKLPCLPYNYTDLTNISQDISSKYVYKLNDQVEELTPNSISLAEAALQSLEDIDPKIASVAWSPAVIHHIVRNCGGSPVFKVFKFAWNYWYKYMCKGEEQKEIGFHVLYSMLISINNSNILAELLFSQPNNEENNSISEDRLAWFLSWVFYCLDSKNESKFRKLAVSICSSLNFLALFSEINPSDKYESISASLSQKLLTYPNIFSRVVSIVKKSSGSNEDIIYVSSNIRFLTHLASLIKNNKVEEEKIYLTIISPLILTLLQSSGNQTVIQLLCEFFSKYSLINTFEEINNKNYTNFITKTINKDDIKGQILVAILCSNTKKFLELIDIAISSFYPNNLTEILIRLCIAPITGVENINSIRAIALNSLVNVLRSLESNSKENQSISFSIALLLWGCSNESELIRAQAISLAKQLGQLNNKLILTWQSTLEQNQFVEEKNGVFSMEVNPLLRFCGLIVSKESLILLEKDTVVTLLGEIMQKHPKAFDNLEKMMWRLVLACEWKVPPVTQALLRCLLPTESVVSLLSWSACEKLLINNPNVTSGPLLNIIMSILEKIIKNFSTENVTLQDKVILFIKNILESFLVGENSSNFNITKLLRDEILKVLSHNSLLNLTEQNSKILYESLLQQQLNRSGDPLVLDAFFSLRICIHPRIPLNLLNQEMESLKAKYEPLFESKTEKKNDNEMDIVEVEPDNDNFLALSTLIIPLQNLIAVLEVTVPLIINHKDVTDGELSSLMLILFNSLTILSDEKLKNIFSMDYYKIILLNSISNLLNFMETSNRFSLINSNNLKPRKSIGKDTLEYYSLQRLPQDLNTLMKIFYSLKSISNYTNLFLILKVFMILDPNISLLLIKLIGEFLSSSATVSLLNKEKFLSGIIELLLVSINKNKKLLKSNTKSSEEFLSCSVQGILMNLFSHLINMTSTVRNNLIRSALSVMKEEPVAAMMSVHFLLLHTVAVYETEQAELIKQGENVETICLSRASQRRARRLAQNSLPEEYFSLGSKILLEQSPKQQVIILNQILQASKSLIFYSLSYNNQKNSQDDLIDVSASLNFLNRIIITGSKNFSNLSSEIEVDENNLVNRGYAATLAILHLEFVLEVLENKKFHISQAKQINENSATQENGFSLIQKEYIELADSILQIISLTESIKKDYFKNNSSNVKKNLSEYIIKFRLETEIYNININFVNEIIHSWSLEALSSLEKLLDGPSFVSILQELLSHPVISIRQRAVLVLKNRLLNMASGVTNGEETLYLELGIRMRSLINSFIQNYILKENSSAVNISSKEDASLSFAARRNQQSALVQSSIMCLDVLLQFLGKLTSWKNEIKTMMTEFISILPTLYEISCLNSNKEEELISSSRSLEAKKILSSIFLCIGTMCKVIGPNILPYFGNIMKNLMNSIQGETNSWKKALHSLKDNDSEKNFFVADINSHIMFLRSLISSSSIIAFSLSNYFHTYLSNFLTQLFYLYNFFHNKTLYKIKNIKELIEDINNCLLILSNKIAPRLFLPILENLLKDIYAMGHYSAQRVCKLIAQVCKHADRTIILNNLTKLNNMTLILLDYQYNFGDTSKESQLVDICSSEAIVEVCLKLTEKELKTFILRLFEWKDLNMKEILVKKKRSFDGSEEDISKNRSYILRSTSFYNLINILLMKFSIIFYPTMSLLWEGTVSCLEESKKNLEMIVQKKKDIKNGESKLKKRKLDSDDESDNEDNDSEILSSTITLFTNENINLIEVLLNTIKLVSPTDAVGDAFIDEKKFDELINILIHFFSYYNCFGSRNNDENMEESQVMSQNYINFITNNLLQACINLCTTVQQDVLWKPLNHKILLLTRHKSSLVRLASIKFLGGMFEGIGDDYLLLLPECLTFLSELLEDDSEDVVTATRETITIIEELSGEKLDTYLQ